MRERKVPNPQGLGLISHLLHAKKEILPSKPVTTVSGRRRPSICTISVRTRSVAVAVNAATTGRTGRLSMNRAISRYEGRKSCPH